MNKYRMYGWTVQADFPLHLPETNGAVDFEMRLGTLIRQPDELPLGETLLDYQERGRRWYAVGRAVNGSLTMRVYGLCDILINPQRTDVELAFLEEADRGMAQVMATGALASLLLYLEGIPVMHSSAVTSRDGLTVAFLGRSGQGKSTLAALMCRDGGDLLTDDVLPVVALNPVTVGGGSSEVRLRETAKELAVLGPARASADARIVVSLRGNESIVGTRRLDALFVPLPNRDGVLHVFRLTKFDAHIALMRYPRLLGWKDQSVARMMFRLASAVAESVPVFGARVPWGPPFRDDIAAAIWAAARRPDEVPSVHSKSGSSGMRV